MIPEELETSDDNDKSGGFIAVIVGVITIGLLLAVALVLGFAIVFQRERRDGVGAEVYDYHTDYDYSAEPEPEPQTSPLNIPPPPVGMAPPLPPEGLPAGWTMEQWNYYGEEYLRRREQA